VQNKKVPSATWHLAFEQSKIQIEEKEFDHQDTHLYIRSGSKEMQSMTK
jgi:hypothetical protein